MPSPDALLALADIASVYDSLTASLTSSAPALSLFSSSQPANQNTPAVAVASVPVASVPVSSGPAKKRPVPVKFTEQAPSTAVAEPSKKAKTALKTVDQHADNQVSKKLKQSNRNRRKQTFVPTPSFPAILMGMLSTPQNSKYIAFLKDNCRFVVLDSAEFESKLLPMHFESTPASNLYWNFTVMLNEWGFKCEKDDEFPGLDVFGHPMFKKGDWEGCLGITKPGPVKAAIENVKDSPPLKPLALGMPPLPVSALCVSPTDTAAHTSMSQMIPPRSHLEAPNTSNLALLNASESLSHHISATKSSRILCNRFGVLQDSSALQALMQIQQARSRMITAAVETLQDRGLPRTISPEFTRAARLCNQAPPSSQLDVMTEKFIKQSVERMMSRHVMRSHLSQGFGAM